MFRWVQVRGTFHTVGAQQRSAVPSARPYRATRSAVPSPSIVPKKRAWRREANRGTGLGAHVRHRKCKVDREESVETEPGGLGKQVPELDIA